MSGRPRRAWFAAAGFVGTAGCEQRCAGVALPLCWGRPARRCAVVADAACGRLAIFVIETDRRRCALDVSVLQLCCSPGVWEHGTVTEEPRVLSGRKTRQAEPSSAGGRRAQPIAAGSRALLRSAASQLGSSAGGAWDSPHPPQSPPGPRGRRRAEVPGGHPLPAALLRASRGGSPCGGLYARRREFGKKKKGHKKGQKQV